MTLKVVDFNPGFWINNTSVVNTASVNPPSGTFAANLNSTGGGEEVTLLPLDLTGRENTGLVLSFFLQPQGNAECARGPLTHST